MDLKVLSVEELYQCTSCCVTVRWRRYKSCWISQLGRRLCPQLHRRTCYWCVVCRWPVGWHHHHGYDIATWGATRSRWLCNPHAVRLF